MQSEIDRRRLLMGLPAAMAGLTLVSDGARAQETGGSSTLVAYFSRSGNTRVVALHIRRIRQAALFEIEPAIPFPEDYEETVTQARRDIDEGHLPELVQTVENISRYDTIYLGLPIWGMTAPSVVRSFLRAHNLSGKILRPFITHGGYGLGDSMDIIRTFAPRADVQPAFSMEADQERRTMEQVRGWLSA